MTAIRGLPARRLIRWVAACATAVGLGCGVITGIGSASADTTPDTGANIETDPESPPEGNTEVHNIAIKAKWDRAIQQIKIHNPGVSASTTTRTVRTKKTEINLTKVTIKSSA